MQTGKATMISRALHLIVVLCLLAAGAQAQTLPLPANLIDLRSEEGEQLLFGGDALEAYVPLSGSSAKSG